MAVALFTYRRGTAWLLCHAKRAVNFVMVIIVQSVMLAQVGFLAGMLRWRNWAVGKGALAEERHAAAAATGLLSIIVPAHNEARVIERTLRAAIDGASTALELVVVDATCTDGTMDVVAQLRDSEALRGKRCTVRTVSAPEGGRGAAINAGLEVAVGDVLMVLHADTILPRGYDAAVRQALRDPRTLMTALAFGTDRARLASPECPPTGLGLMEFTVNVRSRFFGLPFGDQALATTRGTLAMLGGYPNIPIMEDFVLVNAARRHAVRHGGRVRTLSGYTALCSPRRWERRGVWQTNAVNQFAMLWWRFGATPAQIFEFYYGSPAPTM
eukprot:g1876.t1